MYFVPLAIIAYSYLFIVRSVAQHERTLREQAKKMNVASLRANVEQNKTSTEHRLAKARCCAPKICYTLGNSDSNRSPWSLCHCGSWHGRRT